LGTRAEVAGLGWRRDEGREEPNRQANRQRGIAAESGERGSREVECDASARLRGGARGKEVRLAVRGGGLDRAVRTGAGRALPTHVPG
jgi:hypothetical protein